MFPSLYLPICLYLRTYLFTYLSTSLSIYIYISLSPYLFVSLSLSQSKQCVADVDVKKRCHTAASAPAGRPLKLIYAWVPIDLIYGEVHTVVRTCICILLCFCLCTWMHECYPPCTYVCKHVHMLASMCLRVCMSSFIFTCVFLSHIYIILHTCLENLFISTCLGLSPFLFFLGGSENCFLSSSLVEKAGRQPYGRRPGQKTFWYRCEREVPSKCWERYA